MDIDTVTNAYIECAEWVAEGSDEEGYEYAESAVSEARKDVIDFCKGNTDALAASKLSDEQIGHDFYLTRCGHGTGFWDRGIAQGEELSDAAQAYGNVDTYTGDDGYLYF